MCLCVFVGKFVVTTLKSGECFGEEWLLGHEEVRCSVLQCVAVCCSLLQCIAVCCIALKCIAVRYSVLQCLQCVVVFS